ncbi:hypothetical protein [Actinomyces sp.]|uniref:hypothetical protein n=1 Tax=Actinomyces sp. TaxID=29317 RepID=UPI0026DBB5EC|nr:hypothetical protein [Actinomyces sp.]MDO4899762.1 hypothetical protein [Actinomyces sp.]
MIAKFVKSGEPIRFEFDETSGWLFAYSTWFECISPQVAYTVRRTIVELDTDAWFVSFSPPREAFVVHRSVGHVQSVGVGSWDFENGGDNFAVIAGTPCAPWTDRQELLDAVSDAFVIDGIDAGRVAMGYDSQTVSGRITESDIQCYGRYYEASRNMCETDEDDPVVHVADPGGIYQLPYESLMHMGVFSSDLEGYSMGKGGSLASRLLEDNNSVRYLITTPRVTGDLEIEAAVCHFDGSEQVVQLLPGVRVRATSKADLAEGIVVQERCLPSDYNRFDPESGIAPINNTGVRRVVPDVYIFDHSQRLSPWDGMQSEWNIDSTSGIAAIFPSIAVSRRSANVASEPPTAFVKIREEERAHLHPSFTEVYYCAAGAIDLAIFIRGRREIIHIEHGAFAVVREGVPHLVQAASGDETGRFSQICVQLPSRFHYPFHQTKRNYIPEVAW